MGWELIFSHKCLVFQNTSTYSYKPTMFLFIILDYIFTQYWEIILYRFTEKWGVVCLYVSMHQQARSFSYYIDESMLLSNFGWYSPSSTICWISIHSLNRLSAPIENSTKLELLMYDIWSPQNSCDDVNELDFLVTLDDFVWWMWWYQAATLVPDHKFL